MNDTLSTSLTILLITIAFVMIPIGCRLRCNKDDAVIESWFGAHGMVWFVWFALNIMLSVSVVVINSGLHVFKHLFNMVGA